MLDLIIFGTSMVIVVFYDSVTGVKEGSCSYWMVTICHCSLLMPDFFIGLEI